MKPTDEEFYLYHHVKNFISLIWVIPLSIFVLLFNQGILISIFVWICYFIYCKYNNMQLDKNPEITRRREEIIAYRSIGKTPPTAQELWDKEQERIREYEKMKAKWAEEHRQKYLKDPIYRDLWENKRKKY